MAELLDINGNKLEPIKDLDVYTVSCKFYAASGAQVSVPAVDEEDAKRQVLEIMSEHKDAEVVSVHNVSRINPPIVRQEDFEEAEVLPGEHAINNDEPQIN